MRLRDAHQPRSTAGATRVSIPDWSRDETILALDAYFGMQVRYASTRDSLGVVEI